jgi:phosphatidylserine/phosphatidylglycerophosphate/cardiolipin synthase-like enzyme
LKVADDGSDISWLRRQIPVVTDGPLVLMHHKFAVIDGDAVATGSYNWTRSAGKCNFEDLLVIREAAVVGAYQKRFEQLWSQLGSQMTGKPR